MNGFDERSINVSQDEEAGLQEGNTQEAAVKLSTPSDAGVVA